MNGWMKYCQRKGLCPSCTKTLCVCGEKNMIYKDRADYINQGHKPKDVHFYDIGHKVTHKRRPELGVGEVDDLLPEGMVGVNWNYGEDSGTHHHTYLNPVTEYGVVKAGEEP